MSSVGFHRSTGLPLVGWDHVVQSIHTILTTEVGERVLRRPFGARVTELIDKPQNFDTLMDLYMATAEALEPRLHDGFLLGEPRFQLTNLSITPSVGGVVLITATGTYFPRGHLGDFSEQERNRSISLPVGAVS